MRRVTPFFVVVFRVGVAAGRAARTRLARLALSAPRPAGTMIVTAGLRHRYRGLGMLAADW